MFFNLTKWLNGTQLKIINSENVVFKLNEKYLLKL
jgi:hypothetical protein